jgi:hypothetical protein
MAIMTVIQATRIGNPLTWCRRHLTGKIRRVLDRLLFPSLVCHVIMSSGLIAWTIVTVDDPSWQDSLSLLATIMFAPMVLLILGSLAHDVGRPPLADL